MVNFEHMRIGREIGGKPPLIDLFGTFEMFLGDGW
jgi:hypothetical protein